MPEPIPTPQPYTDSATERFLNEAGYTVSRGESGDIRTYLTGMVQVALSVVGIIFLIMVIYGGYLWLTAGGNEEQGKKARHFILRALVGFAITLLALGITYAVLRILYGAGAPTDEFTTTPLF